MLGFLPTRAYRPGTPGATTFLSPLSGTFNYGWDSFHNWRWNEGEPRASELSHDRVAASLLPPRLRLAVVHDQIRVSKSPCGPKVQDPPRMSAVEYQSRVTEGTKGHGDRGLRIHPHLVLPTRPVP